MTPELAHARAEQLASFTHLLDIPILLVIVSLAALRPSAWTQFVIGIVIAVVAASLLNYFIPRLAQRLMKIYGLCSSNRPEMIPGEDKAEIAQPSGDQESEVFSGSKLLAFLWLCRRGSPHWS